MGNFQNVELPVESCHHENLGLWGLVEPSDSWKTWSPESENRPPVLTFDWADGNLGPAALTPMVKFKAI